jgi:hypothetical protein
MKKLLIILLALCSAVFGQNAKSSFVTSVSPELDENSADILAIIINRAVIKSQLFSVLPNDREFRKTLKKEWQNNKIGDERIIALAKNADADYLCLAKITSLYGSDLISVQLVNLKTEPMEFSDIGTAKGKLADLDYFADKIEEAVADMLSTMKGNSDKGGIFLDNNFEMNENAKRFIESISDKIDLREGVCNNGLKIQVNTKEPKCKHSSAPQWTYDGIRCDIDVSLRCTDCKNGKVFTLKGSFGGGWGGYSYISDEDLIEKLFSYDHYGFLNEWLKALEPYNNVNKE